MKVTIAEEQVKFQHYLCLSVDVSKGLLNVAGRAHATIYEDEFSNQTRAIERKLVEFEEIAKSHGLSGLLVVCEPTGGFEKKLLRLARKRGHHTAYVSAEAVNKFRVVETNDSGKTDLKDPHVIGTLARLGKTLEHRQLDDVHLVLRQLTKIYEQVQVSLTACKGRIHTTLQELFCDFSFKKDFLFGRSGRALMHAFSGSPYQMALVGLEEFSVEMKKRVPRIRRSTLSRLWRDAQASALNQIPAGYRETLEWQLRKLAQELERLEQHQQELETRLERTLEAAREKDPNLPRATHGVISTTSLARLIGETGPLRDFADESKLLRYAGLNIRMRQSGKFEGQNKISRKGRPLLRKILGQIIFALVKQDRIFGPYYHKKKESMTASKAMTATMRLFLRKFFGWYRSGLPFDQARLFTCESQFSRAA